MSTLKSNLVKRVERLPKPTNVAGALQPLFEALSNSIHSTQHKYGQNVSEEGRIHIEIFTNRKKENVWATIEDNGEGLDERNWDAFIETDTDNKIEIGGKGVGRLLWLDCFNNIEVSSVFADGETLKRRFFRFVLDHREQIQAEDISIASTSSDTGTYIKFEGLRDNGYLSKFPGRDNYIFQHLASHFLPTFISGNSPVVTVSIGDKSRTYPQAIADIVYRRDEEKTLETEHYGTLYLSLMECDKVASSDLKGSHFVHFIAHDRTVHSQSVDSKLGLKYFGEHNNRVFHAILKGQFLNENVNQERTAFLFEDVTFDNIINDVCFPHIEKFLAEPLSELKGEQEKKIQTITETYPSVAFGDTAELQQKIPSGELNEDAIYGHLARERYRRDANQAKKIRSVLQRLKAGDIDASSFADAVKEAGSAIEEAEQKSLAEYIVRRKVVLDFIELLLRKTRDSSAESSYQREDILHSFICPVRVNTMGSSRRRIEPAASHDLWIVDERLTFAEYFSSDTELSKVLEGSDSDDRPDLLIFDYVHGLRQTENSSSVLLVEFKRPGRTSYSEDENPQLQVEGYIRQLLSGRLTDVRGRPVKFDANTIFYCYVVADIVGKLDDITFSWQRTADGKRRIYRPDNGFRGYIELVGWDDLLEDARSRNAAFFDKAGISGRSFFTPE